MEWDTQKILRDPSGACDTGVVLAAVRNARAAVLVTQEPSAVIYVLIRTDTMLLEGRSDSRKVSGGTNVVVATKSETTLSPNSELLGNTIRAISDLLPAP